MFWKCGIHYRTMVLLTIVLHTWWYTLSYYPMLYYRIRGYLLWYCKQVFVIVVDEARNVAVRTSVICQVFLRYMHIGRYDPFQWVSNDNKLGCIILTNWWANTRFHTAFNEILSSLAAKNRHINLCITVSVKVSGISGIYGKSNQKCGLWCLW